MKTTGSMELYSIVKVNSCGEVFHLQLCATELQAMNAVEPHRMEDPTSRYRIVKFRATMVQTARGQAVIIDDKMNTVYREVPGGYQLPRAPAGEIVHEVPTYEPTEGSLINQVEDCPHNVHKPRGCSGLSNCCAICRSPTSETVAPSEWVPLFWNESEGPLNKPSKPNEPEDPIDAAINRFRVAQTKPKGQP